MSLQEKFQVTLSPEKDDDNGTQWKSFESARHVGDAGSVEMHDNNTTANENVVRKTNYMPPGMEIDNQRRTRIRRMPLSMAGETDVSMDTNPQSFKEGFSRYELDGDDDQYTGEHVDHFYGEVIDEDGNEGFVERNNYLDRL